MRNLRKPRTKNPFTKVFGKRTAAGAASGPGKGPLIYEVGQDKDRWLTLDLRRALEESEKQRRKGKKGGIGAY